MPQRDHEGLTCKVVDGMGLELQDLGLVHFVMDIRGHNAFQSLRCF